MNATTSSEASETGRTVREMVALFGDRASFDAAVAALLKAGYDRADLSVLSSHESLDAAGKPATPVDEALTALVGDLSYAFPLTTAGLIAVVGGPITATTAALIAAGLGGAALKEFLDEITATPHTEDFARALESGGVILWVRLPPEAEHDPAVAEALRATLEAAGGRNVHVVERRS